MHVEMHIKCKNRSDKKMATYNLNGFVWALKPSIPILELTPTNEELKETWLIRSLSYIIGEDAPFIQAIKPFQNVDKAPIVHEQSFKIDKQAGAVDDHDPAAPSDSNNLLEDVDLLFKEDNNEMEHAMDVDNEDGKYCLDDMSIDFEEDKSNGEIKVNLYQEDCNPLCDKIEVVVEENTPVIETSPVIKTIMVDSTLKFDVKEEENLELTKYDYETMPPFTEVLVGLHFCPTIIGGGMPVYISKAKGFYVTWTDVDK
nr:hypothetical protein [Tanacetum cinerariifolium]